jgi:hypothetical protein
LRWVHLVTLLNNTIINLCLAGRGWNQPGNGEEDAFCCAHFLELFRQGDFKAHLNCDWADKFDHSSQSPTLQTPQPTSALQGVGSDGKGKVLRLHFKGGNRQISYRYHREGRGLPAFCNRLAYLNRSAQSQA